MTTVLVFLVGALFVLLLFVDEHSNWRPAAWVSIALILALLAFTFTTTVIVLLSPVLALAALAAFGFVTLMHKHAKTQEDT